ncbi:DUF1853 family protein [Vibrio lentus]|nr:DUF1853 family protein [Vibrio lentus]
MVILLGFPTSTPGESVIGASDNYAIKYDEIQINVEGRTLGAIDFILEEESSQKLQHWEVAIKFYLLHECPDMVWSLTSRPPDKKLDRMLSYQLGMSSSPGSLLSNIQDRCQFKTSPHAGGVYIPTPS